MKKLIIFTNRFPFDNAEPYLESEINYFDQFEEIHIFSLSVTRQMEARNLGLENIKVHAIYYSGFIHYVVKVMLLFFQKSFYKEIIYLLKQRKLNFVTLKNLMVFMGRTNLEKEKILNIIEDKDIINTNDKVILYSYRFDHLSYLITQMQFDCEKIVRVSRAHGKDLYEFRHPNDYIPLRDYILDNIDTLFLISKEGYNYIKKHYPQYDHKYVISYLGTEKLYPIKVSKNKNDHLQILSISNVNIVKRVDLIYKALNNSSLPIKWTHFGDGEFFTELKEMIKNKNPNLKINLEGHVNNNLIKRNLQTEYYDLFINLSTTEGIPVSIMEANSVGIPALATDVGGTSEIVEDGVTGILVNVNDSVSNISSKLITFARLNEERKFLLRKNAKEKWEISFSASKNYVSFSKKLCNLLN